MGSINTETVNTVVPEDVAQRVRNAISNSKEKVYLKEKINNFLWCELPMNTTIHKAEILACKIFKMMSSINTS